MGANKVLSPEASWLAARKVKKFASTGRPVVSCEDRETVAEVMQKLVDNRVLACPVYHHGTNGFIGLIDMMHIINFLTDLHWHLNHESPSYRDADYQNNFTTTPIHSLLPDLKKRTTPYNPAPYHTAWVPHTATYLDVAKVMVQSGEFRVAVVEEGRGKGLKIGDGSVLHIVTQREMIELLFDGLGDIPINFQIKPIRAFTQTPPEPTPIHNTARAIEAFRVLISTHVTAVPIVTGPPSSQTLFGSISIHHIRRLASNASNVRVLYDEDCGTFCKRGGGVRRGSLGSSLDIAQSVEATTGGAGEDEGEVMGVSLKDSVRTVMEKLNGNKCHRCWVVEGGKVLGQVSLFDILREMIGDA
ncbi:hypothetical protein HK097_008724 [Rhizophlyctis rosea]|uniref:CBS domain-containing protein n=1 Tax=Rhizophlyctis rosea TaxID=64517 RepID=A0AAD5X4B1_9FUNG|nr:hypothetical protein HK097_008724 [Rhizophlyctis rosea]